MHLYASQKCGYGTTKRPACVFTLVVSIKTPVELPFMYVMVTRTSRTCGGSVATCRKYCLQSLAGAQTSSVIGCQQKPTLPSNESLLLDWRHRLKKSANSHLYWWQFDRPTRTPSLARSLFAALLCLFCGLTLCSRVLTRYAKTSEHSESSRTYVKGTAPSI